MLFRLIQEEKDSAEQRAEELESQVGGVPMGGDPGAGGQEAMVARWHAHQAYGQMSPPGNDLPAVPSPAMHPRSAISQQKYLVVSHRCLCHCHDVLLCGTCSTFRFARPVHRGQHWPSITLPPNNLPPNMANCLIHPLAFIICYHPLVTLKLLLDLEKQPCILDPVTIPTATNLSFITLF